MSRCPSRSPGALGARVALASCVVVAVALAARPASSQNADPTFPIVLGTVYASAVHAGTLYLGGQFTAVGPNTGSFAVVDAASGSGLPMARIDGTVYAIAPDQGAGWYVGGSFTSVSGVPRANLAYIRADGSVGDWNPGADAPVRALVYSGGYLFAGGEFLEVAGEPRRHVAEIDAYSGSAIAWDADADSAVFCLAMHDSTLWLGGRFSHVGGESREKIAAVAASTGQVRPWNTTIAGFVGGWPLVSALAATDSAVYAAGTFSSLGGQTRHDLGALDPATGLANAFDPFGAGPWGSVAAIVPLDSTVLLGGDYNAIGGQSRASLAEVSAATGAATPWDPGIGGSVNALSSRNGRVLVGGSFTSAAGQPRASLAEIDLASGAATPWNPGANGAVYALGTGAYDLDRVAVGGMLMSLGAVPRANLAAIDLASGTLTGWNPDVTGWVHSISVAGDDVYLGGSFSEVGGVARANLAAVDRASGAPTAWDPGGTDGVVNSVFAHGNTVYSGGGFTHVGGQARAYLAAMDAGTGALTPWNPGVYNWVNAVAANDGRVFVGGSFTLLGGAPRGNLGAVDSSTGTTLAWRADADNVVNCLAFDGTGHLYVGGWFTSVGGAGRARIARLDEATAVLDDWDPGASAPVDAIVPDGLVVRVGGMFASLGGEAAHVVGIVDAATGAGQAWDPGLDYMAWTLSVSDGIAYPGGDLWSADTLPVRGVAKLLPPDTGPPSAVVIAPNGGEQLWDGTNPFLVQWTTSDDQVVPWVDLQYSIAGSGGPWTDLARALPNTGSWAWDASFLPARAARARGAMPCWLRVVAHDLAGKTGDDVSDGAFFLTTSGAVPERPAALSLAVAASPLHGVGRAWLVLPRPAHVRASVYDVHGREVVRLADDESPAGRRVFELPASLPPGVYLLRADVGGTALARKFVVLR